MNAIRIGISHQEMDSLTFKEFSDRVKIWNEKKEEEQLNSINLEIIGAYYTEVMHRQGKHLPKLDKFLLKSLKKRVREKDEDMLQKVMVLNNLFSGKLITNES